MRSSFDTMLGILYGVVEEQYTNGVNPNDLYTRIQKLKNDIITLYNSDELDHREYVTLYNTAVVIQKEIKKLTETGGT